MRTRFLIVVIVLSAALPPASHGFGLLRYTYDAIANQLGLDRGPVPKVVPKRPPVPCLPGQSPYDRPYRAPNIYIQAEGF